MKQYRMMETRAGKIAFGIFLFAMLLLARDSLITTAILGLTKSQFLMLGLICVFALAFLILNRREWKQLLQDRRMLAVLASTIVLLLPMLVKRDWQMMYFSILICLFFAVFLTFFTTVRETAKYFVVMMTVLGAYSLVTSYVAKYLVLYGFLPAPPIFYNATGWEFMNFGLSFAVTWEFWHRNFGIFREPGVYQFFILVALFLNNYEVSWKKNRSLWVVNVLLAVTMLSTFAVGGVIELGLFALFLYFDKKWYKTKAGKLLGISVLAVVTAAVTFIVIQVRKPGFESTVYYIFYDMYIRLTTDSDSLMDRLSAIFTNLRFFLDNPVFGDTVAGVLHGTAHNTSSTLILYAILGILGGTVNVAAWFVLVWRKERNLIGNLVLGVILFMSFNTQNLVTDIFFWLFPFMALVERGLPKLKLPARKV